METYEAARFELSSLTGPLSDLIKRLQRVNDDGSFWVSPHQTLKANKSGGIDMVQYLVVTGKRPVVDNREPYG